MPLDNLTSIFSQVMATISQANWSRVAIALVIVFVFMLARRWITSSCLNLIAKALDKFEIQFTERFRKTLLPAAELFIFSIGLIIAIAIVDMSGPLGEIAEKVSISILVGSIFYAGYESSEITVSLLEIQTSSRHPVNVRWLERVIKLIVSVLGIASVLRLWGIDLGPLVTGIGVASAAAALAAQDLFKNFVAGMSNIAEHRFDIGDWIRAEGVVEGVVEDIALRSTAVRQFDLSLVHVPNSDLANSSLINVSKMKYRRINWTIKLHYGTSVEQLTNITNSIKDYISTRKEFAQPPDVSQFVRVDSFGATAINLLVLCFTMSTAREDYLAAKEGLIFEIKRIMSNSGARFAHESRTFYIENSDSGELANKYSSSLDLDDSIKSE